MAGNSRRRGAMRRTTKKGATTGSGGQRRRGLEGHGPTPPAHLRPYHPAAKRAKAAQAQPANGKRADTQDAPAKTTPRGRSGDRGGDDCELVLGRNPVLECLRAQVPATTLYKAAGTDNDERLSEAIEHAAAAGIAILEVGRGELDRMSGHALHQGVALQIPPYQYQHPQDLLESAWASGTAPLLVALDNVSDPRNLGAVIRSTAAFGGHGVVIAQRRSAAVTAVAWRTSAGAAARLPVARATNLTRTLQDCASSGLQVVGLDSAGDTDIDEFDGSTPTVVVVGSEGKGLSRLVRRTCDLVIAIPMAGPVESLNASVAAGVMLADIARSRRRLGRAEPA